MDRVETALDVDTAPWMREARCSYQQTRSAVPLCAAVARARGAVLVLLLAGCGLQPSPRETITPANRIGAVALGAAQADVHALLGTPDGAWPIAGFLVEAWDETDRHRLFLYYRDEAVVQIRVTSPRYVTEGGISSLSTFEEIRAQHAPLQTLINPLDPSGTYYDAVDEGIAFLIGPPADEAHANPDGEAVAIFVHSPGEEVIIL